MSAEECVPGPDLVPELLVDDLKVSVAFWCGLCGFEVLYDRPEEGFAYLASGTAHIMIEQAGVGRNWTTAQLHRPYGRGVNFQISVASIQPLVTAFRAAGQHLFMEPETKWYRAGNTEVGVVQFLVQDPDGYLVRFQQSLGSR
jgi:catechol 2,3-dioxygenase-like lactoylglutathione lyase family enzyme